MTCATYLNIVADQVHPFMVMVFLDGSGLFQQGNASCHTAHIVRNMTKGVALALEFPRSLSDQESVGCARTRSPVCSSSTLQHTGSAAKVLVPDTTGHIQRVHASVSLSCFGRTQKTNSALGTPAGFPCPATITCGAGLI